MVNSREPERGSVQVVLLLLLMIFFVGSMGTLALRQRWRSHVQVQLALNECVGKTALSLRDLMNRIEHANERIFQLRVALGAATLTPAAAAPLRAALQAWVSYQDTLLVQWNFRRSRWFLQSGCGFKKSYSNRAVPLPSMEYSRPPPDLLGPNGLIWVAMPLSFRVRILAAPRAAAAVVQRGLSLDGRRVVGKWQAKWTTIYANQ